MSRFAQSVSSRPRALTATLAALGVLATATLLGSPTVASADQAPVAQAEADGLQTNVYYTLRDLSTENGTRELYQRIVRAAQEVCPGDDSRWLQAVVASKQCQRQAIARAIGKIGNARLAAIDAQAVMMAKAG